MGFLDKILGAGTEQKVSHFLNEQVNDINTAINQEKNRSSSAGAKVSFCAQCGARLSDGQKFCPDCGTPVQTVMNTAAAQSRNSSSGSGSSIEIRMNEILSSEFSGFEVRKEIPSTDYGAAVGSRNYSYGLFRNGSPVLFILLTEHNRDNNRAFRGAKEASDRSGIPVMNFYTHMENEHQYVTNRIRQAVGN